MKIISKGFGFAQSILKSRSVLLPAAYFTTTTTSINMATSSETTTSYVPPTVWTYENSDGSKWSSNRPTAGSRFEKELPIGKHPIQLYSLSTPNGQKVTILLEELLEAGKDAEYDAWLINIMEDDQFGSGFVSINPNSKIPAMRVYEDGKEPLNLFESGSILLYLAEKYDIFLPKGDIVKKTETMNWLFWQVGSAPFVGGGFGHFYAYANEKQKYPIDRFTMETKRQMDVLDKLLEKRKYIIGDTYTIADIAIFTWYGQLALDKLYTNAGTFLNVEKDYPNLIRWANEINNRPAVQRGLLVNSRKKMPERHNANDFNNINNDDETTK